MSGMLYSMKAAATTTGLSPHVIRIWEKRYGAVNPDRSESNRRRYSETDVERLRLLKAATVAGHNIGEVARLDVDRLRQLGGRPIAADDHRGDEPLSPKRFVQRALDALGGLNAAALDQALADGAVSLGTQGLLQKVVVPLTYRIGDLWQSGDLTAAQEHFATSVIRNFLGNHSRPFAAVNGAPGIVVATPLGQLHELGAVIVATAAGNLGWRVVNLGASLPAAEIASAALRSRARVVALSIVFPADDPRLGDELRNLRRLLPDEVAVLVGGRAAAGYAEPIGEIGATVCNSLDSFLAALPQI
jgi:DNA-binding transcriptional MerR regulator/methanogenic corrinoid protein MtbC1